MGIVTGNGEAANRGKGKGDIVYNWGEELQRLHPVDQRPTMLKEDDFYRHHASVPFRKLIIVKEKSFSTRKASKRLAIRRGATQQ